MADKKAVTVTDTAATVDSMTATRGDGWAGVMPAVGGVDAYGYGGMRTVARAKLGHTELTTLWRQNWLARESIEIKAAAVVDAWLRLDLPDEEDGLAAEIWKYADALTEPLGIKMAFEAAICWAELWGGSLIVLGIDDTNAETIQGDDGVAQPVNMEGIRTIHYAHVVDARNATIAEWDTDPTSPMFGKPMVYQVQIPRAGMSARFHADRVLRFDGPLTPDEVVDDNAGWNDSTLEAQHDAIRDYGTGMHGVSKALEKHSLDLFRMKGLGKIVGAKDGITRLRTRMKALKECQRLGNVALVDADAEGYEIMGRPVAGMADLIDRVNRNAAGAVNVPQARLFGQQQGSARAGSEADEAVFDKQTQRRQSRNLTPQGRRLAALIMAAKDGPTSGNTPAGWTIAPCDLREPDPETRAKVYKTRMEAHKIAIDAGVLDPTEVRSEFANSEYGVTLDTEITEILEARLNDPEPEPPAAPPAPEKD